MPRAERRQTLGGRAQLQVRAADLIAQVQQHFGDAAHANASDSDEVQVLGLKKHFNLVLFRLSSGMSMADRLLPARRRPAGRVRMRERPRALAHAL